MSPRGKKLYDVLDLEEEDELRRIGVMKAVFRLDDVCKLMEYRGIKGMCVLIFPDVKDREVQVLIQEALKAAHL